MKKMNFNNRNDEDDELLIHLLKKANLHEPSTQFVDNTIKKFLAKKAVPAQVHKHLKLPLILMAILGLLLILPLIITVTSGISLSEPVPGLYTYLQAIYFETNSWYLVYPVLLLITILLVVQIDMRMNKHQNLI